MFTRLQSWKCVLLASLMLAGLLLAPTSGFAEADNHETQSRTAPTEESTATDGIAYEVQFDGLEGPAAELEEEMRAVSLSIQLAKDPPRSLASLKRRAEQDIERFTRVLHSNGHYDGTVRFATDTPEEEGAPLPLRFAIDPGPLYLIESVLIRYEDGGAAQEASDIVPEALSLSMGERAEAEPVIAAEDRLTRHYRRNGYPFAEIADRKTTVNRTRQTMTVTFTVDRGLYAHFGAVEIAGERDVDPVHIKRYIQWKPGNIYDQRLIERTQQALFRTGLFDSVLITPVAPGDAAQSLIDIRIEVAERAHRSIGFGVSYGTSVGPGARASWEHRNLFAKGERLRTSLFASPIERSAEGIFRKPFFLSEKQALVAEGSLKDVTSDAFDEVSASSFIGVERQLSDVWTATLGPTLDLIDQEANDSSDDQYTLIGFRGNLRRDSTDDLLNPGRGSRLELSFAPYQDFGESGASFFSASVLGSRYLTVDDDGDIILAGRVRLGSIFGADRSEIPADKRFFAGGGGSVRGYDFQRIGPLDAQLDPVGGRSVMEFGLELRLRVTETIGIVPFIEAGNVYEEQTPRFDDPNLQWGGGLGLRYYTDIGPLRLDFAVPINKRDGVDDDFQIYLSLGQAF